MHPSALLLRSEIDFAPSSDAVVSTEVVAAELVRSIALVEDIEAARRSKVAIRGVCFMSFCITMGLMAGFETLMGIGLRSSYGWSAKQAISAWGPFAISSFLGFATAPKLVDNFNWATLVIFLNPICLAWWAAFSLASSFCLQDLPASFCSGDSYWGN